MTVNEALVLAQTGPPGGLQTFFPLILILGVFYFLLIRPQMKRQKEHKKLLESLDKGSEIVTAGGLAGKIREVGENFLVVEIAQGTEVRVQKSSVTSVVPKGTLEAL